MMMMICIQNTTTSTTVAVGGTETDSIQKLDEAKRKEKEEVH
jgi:hypothetical protein